MPTEHLIVEIEKPENTKEILVSPATDPPKIEAGKEKTEKAVEKVDDGAFAALKTQFDALQAKEVRERRAREAAERDVSQAREEISKVNRQVVDGEYQTIQVALAAAEAESKAASKDFRAALEAAEFDKVEAANLRIADARARVLTLSEGKSAIEARAEVESTKVPAERRQEGGDPVEAYIARYSEPTQRWLREHRECVTDPKTSNRAYAAHYEATAEGLTADTDAYFEFLDQRLGFKAGEGEKRAPVNRVAPAAPVSRDVGVSNGRLTGDRVKLSAREVQAAEDLGLTTAEYARRKLIMTKDGFYRNMD